MALQSKLSPPIIETKLPAQAGKLSIPFNFSRAVSPKQVDKMALILRSVQGNKELATTPLESVSINLNSNGFYVANFKIGNLPLEVGQYYKVQLACKDNENNDAVGFYSQVGVFKYTMEPDISIDNLNPGINFHCYTYTGRYNQENRDPTEKAYSYCFDLYDDMNNLVASSGELLHNSSKDEHSYESTDTWTTRASLLPNLVYVLKYTVKTINGLEISSMGYEIMEAETVDLNIYASLVGVPNQDNGYTSIQLIGDKDIHKVVNGQFILLRSSDEDQYRTWKEMTKFYLTNWSTATEMEICKDFSTAQGINYKYAIQAYNNNGIYSNRLESNIVYTDFEDMFLYDGNRQLKIRFNPKVSSFKNNILETKLDTIGGRYPFFFRNGNVSYKEFPISGLISILSDENNLFLFENVEQDTGRRTHTGKPHSVTPAQGRTQLTGDNFRVEREFKLEVLEWLNNGKPKLFRSPGEGNYIVRLMNVSFTPQDKLSRMLHQFTATAYEIADCNFENLKHYNLVVEDYIETRELEFKQIQLHGTESLNPPKAYVCSIVGPPSTEFTYMLSDGIEQVGTTGFTGTWSFDTNALKENPLTYLSSENWDRYGNGVTVTYAYFIDGDYSEFSLIKSISIEDKVAQIIGENKDIIPELEDIRKSTGAFYYIKVLGRQIINCYAEGGKFYEFRGGPELTISKLNIYYDGNTYYDGRNRRAFEPNFTFSINEDKVDLSGSMSNDAGTSIKPNINGRFEAYTNIPDIFEMFVGNGVLIDMMVYQEKVKTYTIEETDGRVSYLKAQWEKTPNSDTYDAYVKALKKAIDDQMKEMSVNVV